MVPFYVIRGNQYAYMSKTFYNQFLEAKKMYENLDTSENKDSLEQQLYSIAIQRPYLQQMDEAAIATVIFQALAIEAYVNLLGIDILGEDKYYTYCYEKKKRLERASTKKKLEVITEIIGQPLPDGLLHDISALMDKRNDLVHQKPRATWVGIAPYNYDNQEENFKDINAFIAETRMAEKNIDREVMLYEELSEAIKIIRGTDKELIDEFQEATETYSIFR